MPGIELVLGLLLAVAALASLARKLQVPYPILLVLGGLVLGLVPGLPRVQLEPHLVFLVFLPPLLYVAAFFTSIRDVRAKALPIAELAVGLVLATTAAVAVIAHLVVPELDWPAAFALGAIVSPTDSVAATAIAQRLGAPRRIVTLLEGESLLNDATGLVAFRFAVAAALTGNFSLGQAGLSFVLVAAGGLAIGLAVGWLVGEVRRRLDDPPVEITVSLLTPFAAYLPAEHLGVSGVLAAVAAGFYLGRRAPRMSKSDARLLGRSTWEMLVFLLNGLAFILIGLQLPVILADAASGYEHPVAARLGLGLLISLVVIGVRIAWSYLALYRPRWLFPWVRRRAPYAREHVAVVSWAGMRGVVSLAAALSLPLTADGSPFPERNLLILVTFCVILVTLVGQGLSLPWLMRRLGVGDDGAAAREEAQARDAARMAAQARLDQLAAEWPAHLPLIDTLRAQYAHRASHLAPNGREPLDEAHQQELQEHRQIRHAVIEAERDAVIDLRDQGAINDEVLHCIERELDFDELRMEA